jgi:hypothetical protein
VFQDTGLGHPNFTNTYTVNQDCTGSLTHPMAQHDFVIVNGGKEILEIAAQSDRVVTYVSKRQSTRHNDDED